MSERSTLFPRETGIEYLYDINSSNTAAFRFGIKQKNGLKHNKSKENFNYNIFFGLGLEHLSYMFDYSLNFGNQNEGFGHLISCTKKI